MRYVILSLLALSLAGCGRDAAAPTSPGTTSADRADIGVVPYAQSKLDNLWPNDDGHSWSFSYRYEEDLSSQPQVYATAAEVPAAPSPENILPALRTPVVLGNVQTGGYGLVFQGQTTTESGATGQNLVESLIEPGTMLGPAALPGIHERLMNRIGWVRPDLRSRIASAGVSTRKLDTLPILVHGGAWQKTLDYIGTFGDLDRNLAWKFLDANTKQSATFRLQLIPSLAPDVYEDAWVVPKRLQTKDAANKSVEVVYVIDYGVSQVTDASGAVVGYSRFIGYGSVTYLPGFGPSSMLERAIAPVEHPEHPATQVTLSSGGPIAVAVP